ncbi:extracellular solute-binding protein [Klebsiella variicola subsp. variicola]|nr:extracellular solute-binding protein [Klebsiella variicola subsp. variicola]
MLNITLVWAGRKRKRWSAITPPLVSGFGGSFYQNGKLDFSTPASLKAVTLMKTSLDQGLSNPASREYLEEDVRKAFPPMATPPLRSTGPICDNMANDPKQSKVAGDVGIVPRPGDTPDKPGAVNGSMGLGIAKASQHPEEAWQYIHYLTSQPVQDKYAKPSLPVWKASYQEGILPLPKARRA